MRRKVLLGALVLEHIVMLLWAYNVLPGFRIEPGERRQAACDEPGYEYGWDVISHSWTCAERWVFAGTPGI